MDMESVLVRCLLLVLCFYNAECQLTNITFTTPRGEFALMSPNWPNNAPAFHNQVWQLVGPVNSKIFLTCNDISIVARRNCAEGALSIWNGDSQVNLCNTLRSFRRESRRNRMTVQFRSSGIGRFRCVAQVRPTITNDDLLSGLTSPSTNCSCGWTNRRRIVGGTETGVNEYVFPVNIRLANTDRGFCGGSIISRSHILTAAHCIYGLEDKRFEVVIGDHDVRLDNETSATVVVPVRSAIMHEDYDNNEMTNDIAILHLERPIQFNQFVGPICLPSERYDLVDKYVRVLGWGKTSTNGEFSNVLQQVDLKVIRLERCKERYTNTIELQNSTQICTFYPNRDSCQGDSGGPVIYQDDSINRYMQVALVSYGKECASQDPAVNIEIFPYLPWIQRIISNTAPDALTCHKVL